MNASASSRLAGKHPLRWFTDSPDEGDPDCLCSLCETVIAESEDEERESGVAIRMWNTLKNGECLEARFHDACFDACLRAGVIQLQNPGTKATSQTSEK